MPACSTLVQTHVTDFDSGALNTVWYGAYDRPLPEPDPAVAAARQEQREVAAASRAEQREQRDREAAERLAAQEEERARQAIAAAQQALEGSAEPIAVVEPAPTPVTPQPEPVRPALPARSADSSYDPALAAAYVRAVYAANETSTGPDNGGIVDIYRYAQLEGTVYHSTPAIGDLVFFHNTFDADGNGRNNDWYTHTGIVEDVAPNGTIAVLSYVDGQVVRTFMNLENPALETLDGQTANTVMRRRSASDPEHTVYLAGQMFAGFAGLLGNRSEVTVLDRWQPGDAHVAAAQ